jgi:exosortase/archaeosortase family protein
MALLTGHVQGARPAIRISLLILAVPVALAANVARIVFTAIVAEYDYRFAEGVFHALSGWAIFVVGAAVFWVTGRILLGSHLRLEGGSRRLFRSRLRAEAGR